MKIRYLTALANVAAGEVVDRPRSTAEFLIHKGYAIEVWENEGGAGEPDVRQIVKEAAEENSEALDRLAEAETPAEVPESVSEAPKPPVRRKTPAKAPQARRGQTRGK